jgi:hypothetical protein
MRHIEGQIDTVVWPSEFRAAVNHSSDGSSRLAITAVFENELCCEAAEVAAGRLAACSDALCVLGTRWLDACREAAAHAADMDAVSSCEASSGPLSMDTQQKDQLQSASKVGCICL